MLVGAFALAHTPQLLVRPPTEDRDLVLRVHAAFGRVRDRLAALAPDALVVVAGDHIEAFFLDAMPALAVYVGRECAGTFGSYQYRFPIHEPLARAVLAGGIDRGFDLLYTQDAPLDYAFYVPLHFTMPSPAPPIVPLHVNVYLPPQPRPRRCYAWGAALGEILRDRTERYGSPDYAWDRKVLDTLVAGQGAALADLSSEELDRTGNVELRTWITLLGAVGPAKADVYCYEPSWHHGNAVVEWRL